MFFSRFFVPAIHLPRVTQQTDSHCGPAVLELLLGYVGQSFTQDQIVRAAGIARRIKKNGTRPNQLAQATAKLAPALQFWFKPRTSVSDLVELIKTHHQPVGVNWQGLFYDTPEEEAANAPDGDYGHYSVVVGIDPAHDRITIVDTYPGYSARPREFSLRWFESRWWDLARDVDVKTGQDESVRTKRLSFIITTKTAEFPRELGMLLPSKLGMLKLKIKVKKA
jgi:ABC-type bacteriocin/lantibiotic exporter with double-glycine peptidase domain